MATKLHYLTYRNDSPCVCSFWCASAENAEECDFDTTECQKYCENAAEYFLEESDICAAGFPGNAAEANDGAFGNDGFANDAFGNDGFANDAFGMNDGAASDGMLVGGDPCTWGPR